MSTNLRILGINLSLKKRVPIALKSIYGIGSTRAKEICKNFNISDLTYLKELSENKIKEILNFIQKTYLIQTDLKKEIKSNIDFLKVIRSYRGLRHSLHLPVRGQRTHTNARTQKKIKR